MIITVPDLPPNHAHFMRVISPKGRLAWLSPAGWVELLHHQSQVGAASHRCRAAGETSGHRKSVGARRRPLVPAASTPAASSAAGGHHRSPTKDEKKGKSIRKSRATVFPPSRQADQQQHPKRHGDQINGSVPPLADGLLPAGSQTTTDAALVATVTLTIEVVDPFSTIGLGETAQVDMAGAPLQANVTDWLKPPAGETVTMKFAVWPGETVVDAEDMGTREKSCPVPVSVTACGLGGLVASSVTLSTPVRTPIDLGANVTLIVQNAFAVKPPLQLSVSAKSEPFVPLIARLVIVTATFPESIIVNPCAALVDPTVWLENVKLLEESPTVRVAGTAVPVSETGRGARVILFAIVKLPVRVPVAAGVKLTRMEQVAPAARLPTQLSVSPKSEAFVPLIAMLAILTAVEPLFVNVTVWELGVPRS